MFETNGTCSTEQGDKTLEDQERELAALARELDELERLGKEIDAEGAALMRELEALERATKQDSGEEDRGNHV